MIRIDIFYEDLLIKGFTVCGHAGYDQRGDDIVCAAVSALTQTAILGLNEYLAGKLKWEIDGDGMLECWLADDLVPEEQEKAQVILHTMELGLCNIRQSYDEFLAVCKRRWN